MDYPKVCTTYIRIVAGTLQKMKTHTNILIHTTNTYIVCTDATLIVTNGP